MRRALIWAGLAGIAAACALPKVDVDPALSAGSGGTTGGGTTGGSGGTTSGGSGGTGGSAGRGGTNAGGTNAGGTNTGGQAGANDDTREFACYDYCTTYIQNCSDSPANMYTDVDDCLNTCFNSDWPLGKDPAQLNSIQCREVHAHLARDNPNPHCFHSAKVPSGTSCAL
jgi:hypothetical protein